MRCLKCWDRIFGFAVGEADKIRFIDDAKESKLNTAYSASNKLHLQDSDCLLSLADRLVSSFVAKGSFSMRRSDGTTAVGRVSGSWGSRVGLVGRTLDLSSAYKQMPTNEEEGWTRVIVVYSPEHRAPRFFVSASLPFACTSAVYSFNRASKSLWCLFQSMFHTLGITYVDDYLL